MSGSDRRVRRADGRRARSLGDGWAALLAGAAWLGALVPRHLPLGLAGVTVAACVALVGAALRRPGLLALGLALSASTLSARAWSGTAPLPPAAWSGTARLATDPEPSAGALRMELLVDGHRVEAWARGAPARALRPRLAGEDIVLAGELRPPPPAVAYRLAIRHVRARMTVHSVESWRPGPPLWRAGNALRRLLDRGAASLPPARRSLFGGLVLGDDRYQPADLETSFRASGLTHLLAVSGQNVVFVLTVAAPLLRRLRLWPRLAATLAVLGFFALVTRFEPSVLRAVAMASAAAVAATLGRPASSVRLLALAVTGLILVDPLLVHQVGFQLSVLATAGIVVLARPLNRLLPLPPVLALPLSVTLAAQLATGPLLAFVFGPVPLAAVPANLLAEPVAGAAMVYGLAGGAAAGVASYVVGPGVASLVHLPTRAMLWWLAGVASRSARLPLGHLGLRPLCLLLLAAVVAALRRAPRRERRSATVAPAAGSGPRDPPGRGVPP